MYLFMVDYWLPFPSSEYGGLQCFVAENEDDVINLLLAEVDDCYKEQCEDYKQRIKANVSKSVRLKLDSSIRIESGIVKEFIT